MALGTIALDIDGTLTTERDSLPKEVAHYLHHLASADWKLAFVTGRTFAWSYEVLKDLQFPYYLAVQNGAVILEMPDKRVIAKKYLDTSIFSAMDGVCSKEETDYVIYGGVEFGDRCYFRPQYFSQSLLDYVLFRSKILREDWIPVENFKEAFVSFPSIKCFGDFEAARRISQEIETSIGLHAPFVRDPIDPRFYVIQATHPQISKGQALKDLSKLVGGLGKVVAAGDDYNDFSMLAMSDVKIVMENAPAELLQMADIVAPAASKLGIIQGLKQALESIA